jgi:hypothetical protein
MSRKIGKTTAAQLDTYAETLVIELRAMDARRSLIRPLLEDAELQQSLTEKMLRDSGGAAFQQLTVILVEDLIRDIYRLFVDAGKRSISFKNIIRKASSASVLQQLRTNFWFRPDKEVRNQLSFLNEFPETPPNGVNIKTYKNNERIFNDVFELLWSRSKKALIELEASAELVRLKQFRDKHLAHKEMLASGRGKGAEHLGSLPFAFSFASRFADTYIVHAQEVCFLCGSTWLNRKSYQAGQLASAYNMWSAFLNST